MKNNDNTGFLHSTNNSYFPCFKFEKLLYFDGKIGIHSLKTGELLS